MSSRGPSRAPSFFFFGQCPFPGQNFAASFSVGLGWEQSHFVILTQVALSPLEELIKTDFDFPVLDTCSPCSQRLDLALVWSV